MNSAPIPPWTRGNFTDAPDRRLRMPTVCGRATTCWVTLWPCWGWTKRTCSTSPSPAYQRQGWARCCWTPWPCGYADARAQWLWAGSARQQPAPAGAEVHGFRRVGERKRYYLLARAARRRRGHEPAAVMRTPPPILPSILPACCEPIRHEFEPLMRASAPCTKRWA